MFDGVWQRCSADLVSEVCSFVSSGGFTWKVGKRSGLGLRGLQHRTCLVSSHPCVRYDRELFQLTLSN